MSSRDDHSSRDNARAEAESEGGPSEDADMGAGAAPPPRRGGGARGRGARGDADSEGSGEDLLGDNMMEDYREMGALDDYDAAGLDERDYGDLDAGARAAAEAQMRERDAREGRRRGREAHMSDTGEDERSEGGFRKKRKQRMEEATGEEEDAEVDEPFNLETYQVPLHEWVAQEQTGNEIKRRFRNFLETYRPQPSDENIHEAEIDRMCSSNGQSLPVSYLHLSHHSPVMAIWLADVPKQMLELFDEVAVTVVLQRYPEYWMIHNEVHVRITHLPVSDSLRELRITHINALVKVAGVVTRRGQVYPQMKLVHFNCLKCGAVLGPYVQNDQTEVKIKQCIECQSTGLFAINHEQTVYRNYQTLNLQESPGSVPAGRVPRAKEVVLLADLVDSARPGEEVEVTGIYVNAFDPSLNISEGFPVFNTVIEANCVTKKADNLSAFNITDDDRQKIADLAKDPNIRKRLIKSIAPSIYGNDFVKTAVALSMFGGREKNVNGKHRIRGDINVLLLGDPGTAKSQVLKYVEKTAPRAVFATGKGASAVGLTAAVHKDPQSGEWTLEGGALVLADQGVCLIDEFDKMNDADRTSIHEAMEQQSISISKAGIVTTLNARCAVIAAANPIGGRYDVTKTFSENVQLTDPILTRFDILVVLRDEADPVLDEKLANFVLDSHCRAHPNTQAKKQAAKAREAAAATGKTEATSTTAGRGAGDAGEDGEDGGDAGGDEGSGSGAFRRGALSDDSGIEPIDQELLKKYIVHARTSVKPSLANLDQDKVSKLYADLRKESEISNGIPVAVRHVESILRMTEASARMRLSATVTDDDLNMAISCMLESFINAQKYGVQRALRRQFSRYLDAGVDVNTLLLNNLRAIVREQQALAFVQTGALRRGFDAMPDEVELTLASLEERGQRHGITKQQVQGFLASAAFRNAGFVYDGARRRVVHALGERA